MYFYQKSVSFLDGRSTNLIMLNKYIVQVNILFNIRSFVSIQWVWYIGKQLVYEDGKVNSGLHDLHIKNQKWEWLLPNNDIKFINLQSL